MALFVSIYYDAKMSKVAVGWCFFSKVASLRDAATAVAPSPHTALLRRLYGVIRMLCLRHDAHLKGHGGCYLTLFSVARCFCPKDCAHVSEYKTISLPLYDSTVQT